jgi:Fur family transcriptional regulator, ferric uptake regulator
VKQAFANDLHIDYISRMDDRCNSADLLCEHGIRVTPRKRAIVECVRDSAIPLSTADIHGIVALNIPLDLVTVYRTLAVCVERGVFREIADLSGISRYELACVHNPAHPHFRCDLCGEMTCMPEQDDAGSSFTIHAPDGAAVRDVSVLLSGVCRGCLRGGE